MCGLSGLKKKSILLNNWYFLYLATPQKIFWACHTGEGRYPGSLGLAPHVPRFCKRFSGVRNQKSPQPGDFCFSTLRLFDCYQKPATKVAAELLFPKQCRLVLRTRARTPGRHFCLPALRDAAKTFCGSIKYKNWQSSVISGSFEFIFIICIICFYLIRI